MPYDFSSEEAFVASAPIDEQRMLRDALRSLSEQRKAEVAEFAGVEAPAPTEVPESPFEPVVDEPAVVFVPEEAEEQV